MKKIVLLGTFLFFLNSVSGQNYFMSQPEGYGAGTTGGGTAAPVTVTTYAALKAALQLATPAVILVSGTIEFATSSANQYISLVVKNKTIIGLPGARLKNIQLTPSNSVTSSQNSGIINLKPGSNNIIIRNLIFQGPGAFDCDGRDNLTSEATNLWVDHCEFQDGIDGNFDIKGAADNTTVSWCKFTYLLPATAGGSGGSADHRFSGLVGSSNTDFPLDGHYSVTFQNCFWANGCKERMPRARNAELHILNCYYNTNVSGSTAIGLGGGNNNLTCYVENSNFASITYRYKNYFSTDGGTVALTFSNCLNLNGTANVGAVNVPSYTYSVIPVADVATYIPNATCGAGATLSVTSAGVMSTSCPNVLGLDAIPSNNTIKHYPTFVENALNIDLPDSISGEASINIYSITGKKVLSYFENVSSSKQMTLNVSDLSNGLYLCNLKIGDISTTWKFIKN